MPKDSKTNQAKDIEDAANVAGASGTGPFGDEQPGERTRRHAEQPGSQREERKATL